jgi:hypothetical protein
VSHQINFAEAGDLVIGSNESGRILIGACLIQLGFANLANESLLPAAAHVAFAPPGFITAALPGHA